MAEPRRPRVIRTRPGSTRPGDGGSTDAPQTGASAVRATSSKVSVVPVDPAEPGSRPEAGKPGSQAKAVAGNASASAAGAGNATAARWSGLFKRRAGKVNTAAGDTAGAPAGDGAGDTQSARGAKSGTGSGATGGAQVLAFPEPEYKRRRRRMVWTAASLVAVLTATMVLALYSPVLAVKKVVFEGNSLVTTQTLEASLAPLMGKPLPQVTDAQVRELLQPIIQVKSVQIQARPPSTLVVQLVERVPVALLKNDQEYVLVDQDGVQLGATADQAAASLPLIDGGKAVIGQDTFQAMTAVLANLPQSILKQLANASASSPDAVELKLTDGRSVVWGSASDMNLKAQVLQALLNAPLATPQAGKPAPVPAKVFDVSAPRHPVTR